MKKIILYFNTVMNLKMSQLFYQFYRRLIHKKIKFYYRVTGEIQECPILAEKLDLDQKYNARFKPQMLLENKIYLLQHTYTWKPGKWNNFDATHLWNFNLHYFEYGISLVVSYKNSGEKKYRHKFFEFLYNWIDNVKDGDGWNAYTISLRLPNWLIAFQILNENIPQKVIDSIYTQYRWLLKNQEKQLLGNHFFENLKAILICSHFFNENKIFFKYEKRFINEVKREILSDGVHYERSLMYHKIILESIIRIVQVLEYRDSKNVEEMLNIIKRMNTAMFSLEKGMGKTPFFNDTAEENSKSRENLGKLIEERWGITPEDIQAFPDAGYYKIYLGNSSLFFDCGEFGPKYMCGHAHCDLLSFELSIKEKPILVNAGTYQYQNKLRTFFRSTEAHNTVKINESQQAELWGEHRIARGIRKVKCEVNEQMVRGEYKNYKGYYHQRQIQKKGNMIIEIMDHTKGPTGAPVSAFFRAAPGYRWEQKDENTIALLEDEKAVLYLTAVKCSKHIHRKDYLCYYSQTFGKLELCEVLEIRYFLENRKADQKINIILI